MGVLAITHSYSAGVLGWFVERLAEHGLVALMFANSSSLMAPAGGVRPFFGTNPIAWAAPGGMVRQSSPTCRRRRWRGCG